MSFWQKFEQATKLHKSYVCVGLDSDINKIPECLKNEENPIWAFNKEIIDATKNYAAAFKPNYAFYAAAGKMGLEALEKTINHIPSYIPIILDVKVGDIGNTMAQYAKAYFETMDVDSITVNPLMGEDVFTPLLKFSDKHFFSLVLTSNPSAENYLKPNNLFEKLAEDVASHDYKNVGAVVGATNPREMKPLRKLMPDSLFLIPGIGAQGGDLDKVMHYAIAKRTDPRIIINSSRGIIFADNTNQFAEAAAKATNILRQNINSNLDI